MCFCNVLQGVDVMDANAEFLFGHHLPERVRVFFELLAGEDVIEQRWPDDFGVLCGQFPTT